MHDSPDTSGSILFDFADQLLADIEAGRAHPLAHYLARFPGHEEHVAREYLALTAREPAIDASAGRASVRSPDRIGPYRLIDVLGRGGQGIVYRAEDSRLERTVALKVLELVVASVSQGRRTRFRREAEIVSRLDHPGICTVLDADLDAEMPYIAMRFVEGETLATALARARERRDAREREQRDPGARDRGDPGARERGDAGARDRRDAGATPSSDGDSTSAASRLLSPRHALDLAATLSFFERAARALHAAHEAGVVHRDVKPGNIMVSKDGAPVILDFGLARADEEESAPLTRSGDVFGTPAYVSPEQIEGGRDLDRRTDVYSLGVVLYECLTLTRPFQGDSSAALAEAIRSARIPPPRLLNPALPGDLAVVLETALEKDVARRYPTALELAEELRRVREYEPIRARPAGTLLRLSRWAQRNPVVATGTVGSIAALSIALAVALVLLARVRDEQERKEAALHLYEGAWYRDHAASALSYSPPRALHFAIAAAESEPGLASNGALLAALDALYEKAMLVGHEDLVTKVDVDPSSQLVLTSSLDGTARLWNAHTGLELGVLALGGAVHCAAFAPDGDHIVLSGEGGRASLSRRSAPTAPALALVGHTSDVHWAEFSPDGARVLTASRDHTARIWDAKDGRELVRLTGHTGSVAEARFLAGGRFVLTRSAEPLTGGTAEESDFSARLYAASSGVELGVFAGHSGAIVAFDTSRDLGWLVTASEDRTARLWRLDGKAGERVPERVFDAPGKFHGAEFSPDGSRLALAWDAGAKVVDVENGTTCYTLPNHEHRAVVRVAFSPDGERLATIAYDNALRIFRAGDGALLRLCRGDMRQITGMHWSPDGGFLATWQRGPTVDVWYGAERPFLPVLRGHTGEVRTARFDRSGEHVLTASADGTARAWSASSAHLERAVALERVFDPREHARPATPLVGACFDPSGERIATTDETGRVLLWSVRDGSVLGEHLGGRPTSLCASFSPDGTRLLMAQREGSLQLVEIASGSTRLMRAHEGEIACMGFSPDGSRVATGGDDRRVCVWDATFAAGAQRADETDRPLWRSAPFETSLFKLKTVFDVAFSPDGRWVAAACQNLRIPLFDSNDGRMCAEGAVATPGRIVFSADSRFVMGTSKYLSTTTLWRIVEDGDGVELERQSLPLGSGFHHTNSMTCIAAAARAARAVTGGLDRTVRLWDLERCECVASYVGHADKVLDVDISPDAQLIVSASADGTARLWPSDLLAAAQRCEPTAFARNFGPLPVPEKKE